ncbi:MAG: FHA domain-containing protein [Actinomycetota bacterium]
MEASSFVLAVLKYAFLALLYFFIYRAIRTVASDLSVRRKQPKEKRQRAPKTASRGKAPLVVVVRSGEGRKLGRFKLSGPLQIGRGDGSDIRLDDTYVSEHHARLYAKNGSWCIEDLGSTNGTYLNGQRITGAAELHAGDEVRIGQTVLELRR